jgi:SAM-dependent methyltransferase
MTSSAVGPWRFVCPRCRAPVLTLSGDHAACAACGNGYDRRDGVWDLLPPDRAAHFAAFLRSYTRIRTAEGRASVDPAVYCRLPDCCSDGPLARQWAIRRRSFRALLTLLDETLAPGAKVLDLGAGTGWLSHRLHGAGYAPCAVDLSRDGGDGLGAARHFAGDWPRLVAEFDYLPIHAEQADAAIFNASFHYSTDYETTLHEAKRVVRPGGVIVILDSPVYRDAESGRRMLVEQQEDFEARFGERSDSLPVRGFLTWALLAELGAWTELQWRRRIPWYGWRWAARSWIATLRGRREPAKFALIWTVR